MSIRKRESKKADTGYTYQVYFNYIDYYTNESKRFSKSGFRSYEDAKLFEQEKREELNYHSHLIKKYKVTIDKVFQEWLDLEAKYRYQENTIIDYKNRYYKHIQPKLGNNLLSEIDYKKLQQFFNDNSEIGLTTNYKLKEVLSVIIKFAIKCNYIDQNPLVLVHVIGTHNSRTLTNQVYLDEDFDKIIQELNKKLSFKRESYIIALYIGKYTGLRISEVFALNRDDFDFNMQQIYVTKKIIYANKKRNEISVSQQMKTKSSFSTLPFHQNLQEIIRNWLIRNSHDHIICDEKGDYLNPKQLDYTLWKISKKLNINFHFHMLRHTLATRLVNSGADMKATQELMRHSNIVTTLNIYTHTNEEAKKEALYIAFPIND